jgi:proline-specific peptidase
LLTLHGGPGAGHDYLEPLEGLATDRAVVFYDQLGCGKSDQPDDRTLWLMERFVTEVDTVRRTLGLEQIHLLGQSWGGWLAIEYMLTRPYGVVSLTLAYSKFWLQKQLPAQESSSSCNRSQADTVPIVYSYPISSSLNLRPSLFPSPSLNSSLYEILKKVCLAPIHF